MEYEVNLFHRSGSAVLLLLNYFDVAPYDCGMDLKDLSPFMPTQVYLSRRNLLTLLNKLDRKARGGITLCTVIKRDNKHPVYPQTEPEIWVTAVEDADYYVGRPPGWMLPVDDPSSY